MKTYELTGVALDWAVAECEGLKGNVLGAILAGELSPSTQWHYGGPIIEREKIEVGRQHGEWVACSEVADDGNWDENVSYGPTPLIAAMRCYVASKLGDEVEIPEGLK